MACSHLRTANSINPHARAGTNAETETPRSILGANLELDPGFKEIVLETEHMAKKRKTMIKHRNRIKHLYEFWIEKCPQYVALGTVELLTEEQKQDRRSFHYKNTHDLVYEGNNIKYVKAFLG
jgi:hypothetical protein